MKKLKVIIPCLIAVLIFIGIVISFENVVVDVEDKVITEALEERYSETGPYNFEVVKTKGVIDKTFESVVEATVIANDGKYQDIEFEAYYYPETETIVDKYYLFSFSEIVSEEIRNLLPAEYNQDNSYVITVADANIISERNEFLETECRTCVFIETNNNISNNIIETIYGDLSKYDNVNVSDMNIEVYFVNKIDKDRIFDAIYLNNASFKYLETEENTIRYCLLTFKNGELKTNLDEFMRV